MDDRDFKNLVYKRCRELVDEKITTIKEAMDSAQIAAISEEKSTAGDKYDTARAMSHITRDMYSQQLEEALKLQKILSQIDPDRSNSSIQSGSLVMTNSMIYFISVSLGMIEVDNQKIAVISPVSPIGQKMIHAKPGDKVEINNNQIKIERAF